MAFTTTGTSVWSTVEVTVTAASANGVSQTITSAPGGYGFLVNVTSTGTSPSNPTLDLSLQESYDGGSNFKDIWHVERITTTGTRYVPSLLVGGSHRWVYNVGGTASFAFTISYVSNSNPAPLIRQFFDRTNSVLIGTPAGSATNAYDMAGCTNISARINTGAISGTPATYNIQLSDDGVLWSSVGTTTSAIASSTVTVTAPQGAVARFVRLVVTASTTGSQTAGSYVSFSGVK